MSLLQPKAALKTEVWVCFGVETLDLCIYSSAVGWDALWDPTVLVGSCALGFAQHLWCQGKAGKAAWHKLCWALSLPCAPLLPLWALTPHSLQVSLCQRVPFSLWHLLKADHSFTPSFFCRFGGAKLTVVSLALVAKSTFTVGTSTTGAQGNYSVIITFFERSI